MRTQINGGMSQRESRPKSSPVVKSQMDLTCSPLKPLIIVTIWLAGNRRSFNIANVCVGFEKVTTNKLKS